MVLNRDPLAVNRAQWWLRTWWWLGAGLLLTRHTKVGWEGVGRSNISGVKGDFQASSGLSGSEQLEEAPRPNEAIVLRAAGGLGTPGGADVWRAHHGIYRLAVLQ